MTWIKFTTWLISLYAVYYMINIIYDLLKPDRKLVAVAANDVGVITFPEEVTPTLVNLPESVSSPNPISENQQPTWERSDSDTEEIPLIAESTNPNISTGGVTGISRLMKLAQAGTIEMKSKIVYS